MREHAYLARSHTAWTRNICTDQISASGARCRGKATALIRIRDLLLACNIESKSCMWTQAATTSVYAATALTNDREMIEMYDIHLLRPKFKVSILPSAPETVRQGNGTSNTAINFHVLWPVACASHARLFYASSTHVYEM